MAVKRKPKRKPPKTQTERPSFEETARKIEADESGEGFERAFKKIVPPKRRMVPQQ